MTTIILDRSECSVGSSGPDSSYFRRDATSDPATAHRMRSRVRGHACRSNVQARAARGEATGISAEDERLWSDTAYVRTLLRHYGIRASDRAQPFPSWKALPDLALLAIKWRMQRSRSFWHWVVFWRGPRGAVVLDPKQALRTHRRTDFGRMRPKWLIEISRPALSHRNSPHARLKTERFSSD